MNRKTSSISLFFCLTLGGCASVPGTDITPPIGAVYSGVRATTSITQIEASDGVRPGPKKGQACAKGILGVAAWGDMSLDTAKKQGGISRVDTADVNTFAILGQVYIEKCLVITGE